MRNFVDLHPVVRSAEQKHILVVGAGVVGLASALWLQKSGHKVSIIDIQPPAEGVSYEHACSFGNACTLAVSACIPIATPGILNKVPGMLMDRKGPLSIFWRDLPQLTPWLWSFVRASSRSEVSRIVGTLGTILRYAYAGHEPLIADANLESHLRKTGAMYLYRNEKEYISAKETIGFQLREGVNLDIVDANKIKEMEPFLKGSGYYKGVAYNDEYVIDTPHQYMLGLARLFLSNGGAFIQGELSQVESHDNRVTAVVGDKKYDGDNLVVAAGAWSARVAAMVGDSIRLDTERGYHVLFPQDGHKLSRPVCYPGYGFYLTPLSEGLRVAGTVELGGLGRPMRPVRTQIIEERAKELVEDLGGVSREWLGFRPSMPDSLPVIGASPRNPRVIYAFGHGHLGVTMGGITGRLVSDLVNKRPLPFDLYPLRPDRY